MRHFADSSKQEEREVERLSRPAPKHKPPRRDRRRELVQESNSDKDQDQDLSLNYKRVGTLLTAKNPNKKKIQVQITEGESKGSLTLVNPETLQSHPEKYVLPKKEEITAWTPEEQKLYDGGKALTERAKEDPELASMIRDLLNPKGQGAGYLAESTPSFPAKALMRGKALPDGVETLGDLVKALRQSQKTPPGQAESKKEPPPEVPAEAGPAEPSEIVQEPAADSAGESPETTKNQPQDKSESKPKPKSDSKTKEPKTGIRRRVPEEWEELSARSAILESVPQGEIRRGLIDGLMRGTLHVDDVSDILATYHANRGRVHLSTKSAADLIEDVSGWFATNPSKVKPPREGKNSAGEIVPISELTPEERQLAETHHKNRTLALSLVAQEAVKSTIAKQVKAPPALASFLSLILLKQKSQDPERAEANSRAVAAQVFQRTLAEGTSEIVDPGVIKNTFKFVGDNQFAQQCAAAYFQARDYQEVRDRFLKSDSPEHVSEHDSVDAIVRGITRGSDYLSDKSLLYPRTAITQDPAGAYRNKLLDSIKVLAPEKYPEVRKRVDQYEHDLYDKIKKRYDREVSSIQKKYQRSVEKTIDKHDQALTEARTKHDADVKAYTKAYKKYERDYRKFLDDLKKQQELAQSSGYRVAPSQLQPPVPPEPPETLRAPLAVDLMELPEIPELPDPPPKPARYGIVDKTLEDESVDLWEEQKRQVTAGDKRAVYWGVHYKPKLESPSWQQAANQKLTDKDLSEIESRARVWLRELPDSLPQDTRARAAVDHAVRDARGGAYSAGLPPTQYQAMIEVFDRLLGK